MFLKMIVKTDKKTNKRYDYYRLCQSYRIGNKTRHRTIATLGKLDDLHEKDRKSLADRIESLISGDLFALECSEHVETLAMKFYAKILESSKIKRAKPVKNMEEPDYRNVDINSMEHEDVRELGAEWLCKQTVEKLEISGYLSQQGWEEKEIQTGLSHLIARAIYPVSEHKTAQWMQENSSVLELHNLETSKINRHHLYKASKMFYTLKDGIEQYLSKRTNELFDFEDKIILYDLTNTYFEGRKVGSDIAKYGRSKEKRSDAKIVALALVTNSEGFVKYSKIYRGNISDSTTLKQTVEDLSANTSTTGRKPLVVIDAGISTEDNLKMLKTEGYDYLCVTRSKLKDYELNTAEQDAIKLHDKKGNEIEVCQVEKPESSDKYLYVKSAQKALKEVSMDDHFSQRFEEELNNAHASLHKPGGTKKIEKVWRRIGRIQERYPPANKHYEIKVTEQDGKATSITFSKKQLQPKKNHGVYFLRTSVEGLEEKKFWKIYNTLTEIEATFRVLKTDLKIRPIHHKEDINSEAHIFLGILAYTLVNTIRYQLKQKGIKHDWSNIARIMNTQKILTTTMNTNKNDKLVIRSCSKPSVACDEIYKALNYKPRPFYRKNIVLPE
jgi:hypothetical protein